MDPVKVAAGERILEGLEGNHAPGKTPVVFVGRARRRRLVERQPPRFCRRVSYASAISQAAKTDVKLRRAETSWSNFSQVLQFKQDFAISAFAKTVNDGLAFLVVFGQRPGTDRLNVTRAKAGPAVGVKNFATSRLVQHGPDFKAFAEFPTASVQHGAATIELSRFALIAGALGKIVESLFAGDFQPDCLKRCVHGLKSVPILPGAQFAASDLRLGFGETVALRSDLSLVTSAICPRASWVSLRARPPQPRGGGLAF